MANDGAEKRRDCTSLSAVETSRFEEVWRSVLPDLRLYCLALLKGNQVEVEEALSRVAIRAFQHLSDDVLDERAWLRAVARNVCTDLYRERRRHPVESLDARLGDGSFAETIIDPETPEDLCLSRETRQSLLVALEGLPPSLGHLLRLYHGKQMLLREIARATGMSESNVRRRLDEAHHHVRVALQSAAPQDGDMPPPPAPVFAVDNDEVFGVNLPSRIASVRFVQVSTPTGEHDVYLYLAAPPRRFSIKTYERLRRYIEQHPMGWRKRLQLARVLREQGDWTAAMHEYDSVVGSRPAHVLAWIESAEAERLLSGPVSAAARLERGAQSVNAAAMPLFESLIRSMRGRADEAINELAITAEQQSLPYLWFETARIAWEHGRIEKAAEALDNAIAEEPSNAALLAMSHDVLHAAGRESEAKERLAAALVADPSNVIALQRETMRRAFLPHHTAAAVHETKIIARRLASLAGNAIDTLHALAELARGRGSPRRALAMAASMITAHPRNAEAWLRSAEIRDAAGVEDGVVDALRRACELDPANARAGARLAAALAANGEDAESLWQLDYLLNQGERHALSIVEPVPCSAITETRIAEAAERVLGVNPTIARAHLQLGRCGGGASEVLRALEIAARFGDWKCAAEAALEMAAIEPGSRHWLDEARQHALRLATEDTRASVLVARLSNRLTPLS